MKLYCSLTSPYARVVRALVAELGIADQVQERIVDPWSDPAELQRGNPLGKVPALETGDGLVLPDSRLIGDYLIATYGKPVPDAGARWRRARDCELARGVIDAAVAMVIETLKRPLQVRWESWLTRQRESIGRALDALEQDFATLATPPDGSAGLFELTLGCGLGYLDFRFPDFDWRARRPRIADWYSAFAARPSMQRTRPPA